MAAIWGAAGCDNYRYPTRRQHKMKQKQSSASGNSKNVSYSEDNDYVENDDNEDFIDDANDHFGNSHKSTEQRNHD